MHDDSPDLLAHATTALEHAYCPYSHFRVGAALRTQTGEIFTGVNVENASFGLTLCAERVALAQAIARGHRAFQAMAIVTDGASVPYPCGACRQVLSEFCEPRFPIICATREDAAKPAHLTLGALLPHAFRFSKSGT